MSKHKIAPNDNTSPIQHLVRQRDEQDTLAKQLAGARIFCALMNWHAAEAFLLQAATQAEPRAPVGQQERIEC